jgi:hypothetical protein
MKKFNVLQSSAFEKMRDPMGGGPQSPSAAEQFPAGRLEGYPVAVKPVGLARRQFDLYMRAIIADIQFDMAGACHAAAGDRLAGDTVFS